MAVVACGLNVNGQIIPEGPPLLCCPTPVGTKEGVCEVHIACSHILWKTGAGWKITGYRNHDHNLEREMKHGWKISASEKRIAAINNDGAVVLREKGRWRELYFQRDVEDSSVMTAVDSGNLGPSVQQVIDEDSHHLAERNCLGHHSKSRTKFSSVCVEDNSLIALDEDGKTYSSGVPLPYGGNRIRAVQLGKEHCLALTTDGVVLTWGSGMRGQLGNGELCQTDRPEPVESLQGITISSIACGGWHCVALSTSGDAYAWGWNESGQLGFPAKENQEASILGTFIHSCQCPKPAHKTNMLHGDSKAVETSADVQSREDQKAYPHRTESCKTDARINMGRAKDVVNVQTSPRLLDFWNEDMAIIDVKCGDRHTLYQLEDGSVWSSGMNKYGQLGLGDTAERNEPCLTPVTGVTAMYAGGWISVFIGTGSSAR
ncbi:E3 ubiquitin-protein ligase HERC2-like isoform X2 [Penaeus japonicus]|uniref:E3 ubiquitin-protein ligase HERC2-like isoform X2 n=1 Tax=Penaeus japonicus TaxID=27405 RepID=UPI001C711DA8|nr:E3 ubiquitin-protein ligase HERC2-like isoform X2 [Penaeus japonicus]